MNDPAQDPGLLAIARAISTGLPVEWDSAEAAVSDARLQAIIRELRVVSDIAELHSTLAAPDADVSVWDSIGRSADVSTDAAPDAAERRLPAWGPLLLIERVGQGAFGEIYRAWDRRLHREVALKLLRRHARGESDSVGASVIEEGRLLARVRHPNIVSVYGADRIDGRVGVWMEFVRGRTLERVLRDHGPLSSHEATLVGCDLCRALSAVHLAGLLHRDVKAQNVMREDGGRVVLMDFGTGRESQAETTAGSDFAGTPLYMAPEVLEGQPATRASDLYSLGVLLFHLVTGSYPVKALTLAEIRAAHTSGSRAYLRDLRPDLDSAFADSVQRALDPDPLRRFETAGQMERALSETLPGHRTVAPVATAIEPAVPSPAGRIWHRRPSTYLMAAIAGGALAAAVYAGGFWRSLGGSGGGSAAPATSPAAAISTPQTRQVPAPGYMFLGRPSPRGNDYSFVDTDGDLAVFDSRSGEKRKITQTGKSGESAFEASAFSPDGRQIAYAWEALDKDSELRIINTDGSRARLVLKGGNEVPMPVEWSRDGGRILTVFKRKDGTKRLALVSTADGAVTPLTELDARHSSASLSPDGRFVVFDKSQAPRAFERDIYLLPVDNPAQVTTLIEGVSDDFGPMWTRDDAVVFVSDRSPEPSLWSVPVHGGVRTGEPVLAHANVGTVMRTGLNDDGTLFFELLVGMVDVSIATIDFSLGQVVQPPRPVSPSRVGSNMSSAWSPDGRSLAYISVPRGGTSTGGFRRLTVLDVDSGSTRVLYPPLGRYANVRWSVDGRKLLVKGDDLQGRNGLFLVDPDTGAVRSVAQVDRRRPEDIGAFQWGADHKTILLTRAKLGLMAVDLETGVETAVVSFASEGISGITPGPGFRLSPDGRSIAYSAYQRNAAGDVENILRVKEMGGASRELARSSAQINLRFADWTRDGQDILFLQAEPDARLASLWRVPASGGAARPAGLQMTGLRDVSVHPDGRRLTFTSGWPSNQLWALENWRKQ